MPLRSCTLTATLEVFSALHGFGAGSVVLYTGVGVARPVSVYK